MNGIIDSQSSLTQVCTQLITDFKKHGRLTVKWSNSKKRSLDQNSLWAAMYPRISQQLGDGTAQDIAEQKAYCKLMLGVPILMRDDERFREGYKKIIGMHPYKTQLYLMGPNPLLGPDGFPVTRLFSPVQGSEYTEAIDRHFTPQGVYFCDLLDGKNGH